MNLSEVSHTAILTLICRVVESQRKNPVFTDPMAVFCFDRLMSVAPDEEKKRINKWKNMYSGLQARDARARVLRAMSFDKVTNQYISDNPGCTVINLACGFDTRYWRIENDKCQYMELDLPGIVELKREIFEDHPGYELIPCSVLDPSWIEKVTSDGNSNFLLLAEGLFMYLSKQDAVRLLQVMARRFTRSQLVLDWTPEKYTRGLWKFFINLESRVWGIDVSFVSGINHPGEIESYAHGLKVINTIKGLAGSIITAGISAA